MFSSQEIIKNKNSIAIDLEAKDLKAIAIDGKNLLNIEDKAIMLMETLGADHKWLAFYCKCLHNLPESTIQYILEGAKKAQQPDRYFAKSASAEMKKLFTN